MELPPPPDEWEPWRPWWRRGLRKIVFLIAALLTAVAIMTLVALVVLVPVWFLLRDFVGP